MHECRIGTPLAGAALTPGQLKHGKKVDINHLHVPLARVHASVLKATAKQHGIRLIDRETSFMFGLLSGERVSGTYSTSCDDSSDAVAGACPH